MTREATQNKLGRISLSPVTLSVRPSEANVTQVGRYTPAWRITPNKSVNH